MRPGYEEALAAELAAILAAVPNEDLAIQWDCAWEVSAVYGTAKDIAGEADIATHVAPIGRLSENIPDVVKLGFHFCFGTFGGWPAFAPADLGRAVDLVNAAAASTRRRVDWVHIPTLDVTDDAFYAPLANLDVAGARVYLGAIHNMATLEPRLAVARQYLPDFGLAAYCGFGRTPPADMPQDPSRSSGGGAHRPHQQVLLTAQRATAMSRSRRGGRRCRQQLLDQRQCCPHRFEPDPAAPDVAETQFFVEDWRRRARRRAGQRHARARRAFLRCHRPARRCR